MKNPEQFPYKKTTITVTVISDDDWTFDSLEDVARSITTGGCSGELEVISEQPLSPYRAAQALEEQGSDPAFLLGDEYDPPPPERIIGSFEK